MSFEHFMDFVIPGKVMGKQRHRTTKTGRTYTPKQTVLAENWIRTCVVEKVGLGFVPYDRPVRLTHIRIVVPVAKSWSKKKKAQAFMGEILPIGKPDLDNVEKLLCDALNGILWVDDSRIVSVLCKEKVFGDQERLEFGVAAFNEL